MQLGFEKDCFIGLVFDIHDFTYNKDSGLRFLKNSTIKFLSDLDKGHKIFVSGNDNLPKTHGQSICQISNFKIEDKHNVNQMLRDALDGIGVQHNCKKYIFIYTNKFNPKQSYMYENIMTLNENKGFDCFFHVFEFGKITPDLQTIVHSKNANYYGITDMKYFLQILDDIKKEIKNG